MANLNHSSSSNDRDEGGSSHQKSGARGAASGAGKRSKPSGGQASANVATYVRMLRAETLMAWLKPGLIVLLVVGIALAYFFDLVGEQWLFLLIGSSIMLVPLAINTAKAMGQVKPGSQAIQLLVLVGLVASVALFTLTAAAFPGRVLFEGTLTSRNPAADLSGIVDEAELILLAQGHLEDKGAAEFRLDLESPTGTSSHHAKVKNSETNARVGRRRMPSKVPLVVEHFRFLPSLSSPPTAIKLSQHDASLDRVEVTLRHQWLPVYPLFAVAAVLLLFAMYLDARLSTKAGQSHMTLSTTFAVFFAALAFHSAVPGRLVSEIAGATILAALSGMGTGIVLEGIGRQIFQRRA